MLYELNNHRVDFPSVTPRLAKNSKLILWFQGKVVVRDHDVAWPYDADAELKDLEFVALLDDKPYFTANVQVQPKGTDLKALRELAYVSETAFMLCARARNLLDWYRQHRFCGQCGKPTERVAGEPATSCSSCRLRFYPRISPCVIVVITRGDEMLLAQGYRHREKGWYGAVAGFIETGESAEQAVIREVREEVGVDVGNIRYMNSQAWPFPNQLMLGFTAEYLGGEIQPQPGEIEDARWFHINDLPAHPPGTTIAGWLIKQYQRSRQLE